MTVSLNEALFHWLSQTVPIIGNSVTNAIETIISPQAILNSSDFFASWTMTGYKDTRPGAIRFDSHDGFLNMIINLVYQDGLY